MGLQNDGYLCTALVYNKDLYLFHDDQIYKVNWFDVNDHRVYDRLLDAHLEHVEVGLLCGKEIFEQLLQVGAKL